MSRFITLAIHTYEKALSLRTLLENEGINVELHNVNLEDPRLSSGVRVRIPEHDLPLALRIVENRELFADNGSPDRPAHTVLVPVDFSEHSYNAACAACEVGRRHNGSITLLYSYLDPYLAGKVQLTDTLSYETGERGARQQLEGEARRLMDNFAERLRSHMKRGHIPIVKVNREVAEGVPEDTIVDFAKANTPRLIVMGTRSAERKQADMIGSVTAEVLDEGRFTVLTVPEPLDCEAVLSPRHILFFSNLDQNDILAIDTLYRLFGDNESTVTLAQMPRKNRFSESAAEKALSRLTEYCAENYKQYRFETAPVRITDDDEFSRLQDRYGFDLIVLPNRRRNALSRLINPGLAHRIIFGSDIPMLVIPV